MAKICDLKTNDASNLESNSKNGNTFHTDNITRNQNEEILCLREENKNKNSIKKTLLKNLELSNGQTEIKSSLCKQIIKEPRRIAKKNHFGKSRMDNHVSQIDTKF